jgi:hypothetical protein
MHTSSIFYPLRTSNMEYRVSKLKTQNPTLKTSLHLAPIFPHFKLFFHTHATISPLILSKSQVLQLQLLE